jgi:L-ascorbate metabolism protein UlaG (beta-lactamase superfamily)
VGRDQGDHGGPGPVGVLVALPGRSGGEIARGTTIAIDPYLSEAAFRSYRQVRAVAAPLSAEEAELDALLASHSHEDHLGPDSLPMFMSHPGTLLVGPPLAVAKAASMGIGPERARAVARGDQLMVGDLSVRAVRERHEFIPEPTPDAVGYVVQHDGVSLYHSGDTEYDAEIIDDTKGVTISFVAINGTAGNMNAHEAALMAWRQGARAAVPFHYGLWPASGYGQGATIDPGLFVSTYHRLEPAGRAHVLSPGQGVEVDAEGGLTVVPPPAPPVG